MTPRVILETKPMICRALVAASYVAVIAVMAAIFPGETIFTTILWSVGLLAVSEIIYRGTSTRSIAGEWLIFVVCLLLSIGDILNIHHFTAACGSTPDLPTLANSDAATNYYVAYQFYDTGYFSPPVNTEPIYRWLIALMWRVTGVSVATPIFVNSIMIAIAVIFSGLIARNIINDNQSRTPVIAMGMTAAVCYFLNSGTIILKDADVCMSVALMTYAFSHLRIVFSSVKRTVAAYSALIVGGIILALFRVNYMLPMALGALLLTPWKSAARWHGVAMLAWCGALWLAVEQIFPSGSISFRVTTYVDGYGFGGAYFQESTSRDAYYGIFGGDYFRLPIWKKVLFAPVGAAVQFLTPFPWNFARDAVFGPTLAYAHFSYPWYVVGGLVLYFYIVKIWRSGWNLFLWALWALLFWMVPVYMFAGAVSRYALPVLPCLVPLAILAWRCRRQKSFKIFAVAYMIILAVTLTGVYMIQSQTS